MAAPWFVQNPQMKIQLSTSLIMNMLSSKWSFSCPLPTNNQHPYDCFIFSPILCSMERVIVVLKMRRFSNLLLQLSPILVHYGDCRTRFLQWKKSGNPRTTLTFILITTTTDLIFALAATNYLRCHSDSFPRVYSLTQIYHFLFLDYCIFL